MRRQLFRVVVLGDPRYSRGRIVLPRCSSALALVRFHLSVRHIPGIVTVVQYLTYIIKIKATTWNVPNWRGSGACTSTLTRLAHYEYRSRLLFVCCAFLRYRT